MEFILHFVFELGKITLLSCVYASLALGFLRLFAILNPNNGADTILNDKLKIWFFSVLIIFAGLFIFMFTYWGNHGFGDAPRVPIGHGLVVDNTNWTEYGYIEDLKTIDSVNIEMTKFKVIDGKLIGNLASTFYDYKNSFFVYGLKSKIMTEFKNQREFDVYAVINGLPTSEKLLTFGQNYRNHWSGWRFWLLP